MTFRLLTLTAVALIFSAYAGAQTPVTRIAVIDSSVFGEDKVGITKYFNAYKSLLAEFKPEQDAIDAMGTRLQTLTKEIDTIRTNPAADRNAAQAKVDEAEKLQRDIKFKSEDARAKFTRREQQLAGPIRQLIGTGLQEYAKQKGYAVVFDLSKDQTGLLIAIGDEKIDITKDFITFFNAKP